MSRRWFTEPMTEPDLPEVVAIEGASFRTPWPREAFLSDLAGAPHARSLVLRDAERPGDGVRGYVCFWVLEGEMTIHNIATHPADRRQGGASHMLAVAFEEARRTRCRHAYLEVRPSNLEAIRLYRAWGFEPLGRRRAYYEDTGEDALILRAAVPPAALKGP